MLSFRSIEGSISDARVAVNLRGDDGCLDCVGTGRLLRKVEDGGSDEMGRGKRLLEANGGGGGPTTRGLVGETDLALWTYVLDHLS